MVTVRKAATNAQRSNTVSLRVNTRSCPAADHSGPKTNANWVLAHGQSEA